MTNPDKSKLAVIGECMLELGVTDQLADQHSASAKLSFGGDTLNMSVYLARLGTAVEYITALGDDSLSDWMVGQWQTEGVGCNHVFRHANGVPGLYMIELDKHGERSFKYWRSESPASQIIDQVERAREVFKAISNYQTLFLSGISLAILKPEARDNLIAFLTDYRDRGGTVVFDCNHRPTLWQSPEEAMQCYRKVYQITEVALPTYEDEQALFAYQSPEQALDAIHQFGVTEIVLKMGDQGCQYSGNDETGALPGHSVDIVDTTSAGDSFNAGYLNKRLQGASIKQSCAHGNALASTVIQHRGAIIPLQAMSHLI